MEIVRTRAFDDDVLRIGASVSDVDALIDDLIESPKGGDVVKGLGGARKSRFALKSRSIGKSGGGRVIYITMQHGERIFLLMAYAKTEKAELTTADRKAIKAVITAIASDEEDRA